MGKNETDANVRSHVFEFAINKDTKHTTAASFSDAIMNADISFFYSFFIYPTLPILPYRT